MCTCGTIHNISTDSATINSSSILHCVYMFMAKAFCILNEAHLSTTHKFDYDIIKCPPLFNPIASSCM